ncbi:MAG: type II toxin-antitoxin system HicB family antitoxin [Candidatus Competibacteraceae bacterium]|nr:type II toxin-antitoxin system HicB family antitoxin [Candidatus Competibacteraceae bacterium]
MFYPVYIHPGDDDHAHGVTFPDFPGCFSAADQWDDLPRQIQDAVELYFENEEGEIPLPTPLEALARNPTYTGGVWMLADLDLARIQPCREWLNVSLPAALVGRIDRHAAAHHLSRSAFLALAAERAMTD